MPGGFNKQTHQSWPGVVCQNTLSHHSHIWFGASKTTCPLQADSPKCFCRTSQHEPQNQPHQPLDAMMNFRSSPKPHALLEDPSCPKRSGNKIWTELLNNMMSSWESWGFDLSSKIRTLSLEFGQFGDRLTIKWDEAGDWSWIPRFTGSLWVSTCFKSAQDLPASESRHWNPDVGSHEFSYRFPYGLSFLTSGC